MSYSVTKDGHKTTITYEWSKRSKVIAGFLQLLMLSLMTYYLLSYRNIELGLIAWLVLFMVLLSFVFYKKQFIIASNQIVVVVKQFYFFNMLNIKGNLEDYYFKRKLNHHTDQMGSSGPDGEWQSSTGRKKSYTSNLYLINKHGKHRKIHIYAVHSDVSKYKFKSTCEHLEKTFGIEILDYYKR